MKFMAITFSLDAAFFVAYGFVITLMWKWLVIPPTGWMALPLAATVGMVIILNMLTSKNPELNRNQTKDEALEKIIELYIWKVIKLVMYPAFAFVLSVILL